MRVSTRQLAWEAGHYIGVPFWVMWGVAGNETDYGRAIGTSSVGAKGWYQFTSAVKKPGQLPYPMVNSTNVGDLAKQAIAAAQYLRALYYQYHDWHTAIAGHYYGGYEPVEGYRDYYYAVLAHAKYTGAGLWVPSLEQHPVAAIMVHEHVVGAGPDPHNGIGVIVKTSPGSGADPPDHSRKVYYSGKTLGVHGSNIHKRTRAMRSLRTRPIRLG